jgi:hypothetical protein
MADRRDPLPRIGEPLIRTPEPTSAGQRSMNEEMEAVNASDAAAELAAEVLASNGFVTDEGRAAVAMVYALDALRQEMRAHRIAMTRGLEDLGEVFADLRDS